MFGLRSLLPFPAWMSKIWWGLQAKLMWFIRAESHLLLRGTGGGHEKSVDMPTNATVDNLSNSAVNSNKPGGELLWEHPSPADTQMWNFLRRVNVKYGKNLQAYHDLHHWSINNAEEFWGEVWDQCGIRHSKFYEQVIADPQTMWPRPAWFQGARLNFAENLLFPTQEVGEDDLAVIAATETTREMVTWKELRMRVCECQAGMKAMNVQVGDRIAGYVANHTDALVAMLASTSIGAVWTAVSPDTGVTAALDRLVQIEPSLLFADNGLVYNGKTYPALPNVKKIVASLPSLKAVIIFPTLLSMDATVDLIGLASKHLTYREFTSVDGLAQLEFTQLPAEHPVYILYSSGTTGPPKCIVHGAIGTLIQHKKEHILQSDIRPGDRLFFVTTCMWMMWHWLVSGLASGATVVLYNGSPFYYRSSAGNSVKDNLAMPKLVQELSISEFGTSAKYLSLLEQDNVMPKECGLPLSTLKAIYSTGSPLAPSTFRYVYRAFSPINLGSISGGTDIISDFGTPSPLNPVYAGEIQVVGLGMAVQARDAEGKDMSRAGVPGELVCVKPFPSQPVGFWGPAGQDKYRSSYFERFPGVWAHGDFIRFNPQTGGLIMLGRSDGVLNPGGVRFGSAEMYSLLLKHFAHEVDDALCVGRKRRDEMDETVVLFLKMRDGQTFTGQLADDIRSVVRQELSPRHVPGIVDECPEIPVTANGKKVEVLVKQMLSGMNIKTRYTGSVVNVDCLDWYREWAGTH